MLRILYRLELQAFPLHVRLKSWFMTVSSETAKCSHMQQTEAEHKTMCRCETWQTSTTL